MKHSKLIGVDLGGSNVRVGLVKNKRIAALEARSISPRAKQGFILNEICDTIAAVFEPDVSTIGIGVPGTVDMKGGIVHMAHNLPTWRSVPIKRILERRFGVPTFVNNDANCFALGELHFGLGKGYRHLIGLIVGTGLGAGVVIDGKLYSGNNGGAGEIGAMPYRKKTFEYYCSGRFFEREFGIDAATLQVRADNGDRRAQKMFAAFGDDFSEVIMTLLYAYDPEIVVLGGSVSKAYPYFEKQMREKLRTFGFQKSLEKLVIARTQKPNIAVLGAAVLCLDNR
ncbi:MAG TPA: ROK family protein [Verrucomicrobiae bacterium]|nr:ROK family protein [Verrucomicrobiae bacterium]